LDGQTVTRIDQKDPGSIAALTAEEQLFAHYDLDYKVHFVETKYPAFARITKNFFRYVSANADADVETAVAHSIKADQAFGQLDRISQRQQDHRNAQAKIFS
jgi:hypothetical protein